jgi:SAM-dependent methyltransferase
MELLQVCNVCQSESFETADRDWNLCRCNECGYIFESPRPTLDEIIGFYSKPGKYDSWIHDIQPRENLWQRRLEKLLPHRSKGNLLDVGTGIGQFLNRAKPFFSDVRGTEVSESAVAIAREKYHLNVHQGVIEELDFPPTSFDNITLFHVLEHVPNPATMVQTCHTLLRNNGTLIIAVPNDVLAWTLFINRVGKRLGLRAFQKFSPKFGIPKAGSSAEIHLSHFTPAVLRDLLKRADFSIIEESIDPYYVATGLKLWIYTTYYTLHRLLFSLTKINRYDTIWMVARKQGCS